MPAQTLLKTSPGGPSLAGGRRHTETKFSCVVFIGQISCEIRSCCFYLAARITRQRGRTPAGQVVSGKKRKSHLKGTSRIASCKFGRGHVDREQLIDSAEAHFLHSPFRRFENSSVCEWFPKESLAARSHAHSPRSKSLTAIESRRLFRFSRVCRHLDVSCQNSSERGRREQISD